MTDVVAVVSRAVFEPELKKHDLAPGVVWSTRTYASQNKGLAPLASGGRLFLVTVRPPDEALWLVAVLEQPTSDGTQWSAAPNTTPVRDVSALKHSLKFENGQGLPDKPGVLGMSLQTPRTLTPADVALLLGETAPPKPEPVPAPEPAAGGPTFEHVLAAWRRTRHPRYATVAEAIAAKEPERKALGASNKNVDLAAWLDLEREDDWRDTPRLLNALTGSNSPNAAERVTLIARRDDPRISATLLNAAADPPYTAGTSKHFWQAVARAFAGLNDVRLRDPMLVLSKRYKLVTDTQMGQMIARDLHKVASEMKPPRPLSADEERELAVFEAALGIVPPVAVPKTDGASNAESLFAAIAASPDDDDARLIYADVLSENGDDRGEFILLQVERATGRGTPERSDLERHKFRVTKRIDEFALPLSTAADRVIFERGFPVEVNLQGKGLPTIIDAPEWATVRRITHLEHATNRDVIALLGEARLTNLDDVTGLAPAVLNKLKKPATFPWSRVQLLASNLDAGHVARFPNVRRLEIATKNYQPVLVDPNVFDAAPAVEEIAFSEAAGAKGILRFAGNPCLKSLVVGRTQMSPDGAFEAIPIEKLSVYGVVDQVARWLEMMTEVRTLVLQANLPIPEVVDLMRRFPRLQCIDFGRYNIWRRSRLERTPDGEIRLVLLPSSSPYAKPNDDVGANTKDFHPLGITKLVLHPLKPRHELMPTAPDLLQRIRDAWGAENVSTPELL